MKARRRAPRFRALATRASLVLALAFARRAEAASDPSLRWYTIETPHFRVTYHTGSEEVAQRVATIAESINGTMQTAVGWAPRDQTEIILTDFSESANGSATALPYNAINLIVTAPEDMSPLGDVDDWQLELVSHEYTHILHTDNIHGLPALVNAVLGKTLAPNQVQPRWILEGYAVFQESARTSGGRLRSSMWDMYMRTDVLSGTVASIDQLSNGVRRWPQGNLWYLYGSYFTQWIAETYGEQALRSTSRDYGAQIVPWGFNRSLRRATGHTYVELYPEWIASMKKRYGEQAAAVRAQGIREGVRITHHGQVARYPRWIPDNAWPEHAGQLLYWREDQHVRHGLWSAHLARDARGAIVGEDTRGAELIARTSNESYASFLPDGGLLFNTEEFYKGVFSYYDLERLAPGEKSSAGSESSRTRLTNALRAADPATSPDGRRVVFTVNRAGTRSIQIADLEPTGLTNMRPLVPTARFEQAFTPRWSPDGEHVAYGVWKVGGYRDIRIVDVRGGGYHDITVDRAIDGGPSFSPDGKYLYFHSDRTGIANLYAYELATGRTLQVTNVLTGAYSPEPSPDGKTLAYVGYTKDGFDLFAMTVDESTWTEAPPYVDDRPPAPTIPPRRWEAEPYSPWPTLRPRRFGVQYTQGSFGDAVIMSVGSSDITGIHSIAATSVTELEKPELQGALAYTYGRLPFDLGVTLARSITPRGGYALGSYKPTVVQETTTFGSSLVYAQPGPFDSRAFVLSHALSRVGADYPMPTEKLDPYETPQLPPRGLASSLHFGFSYTSAERYLWSVGPERGLSLSMGLDVTHPTLGSDFDGFVTNGDFSTYFTMPWLKHHALALHAGGGTSGGAFPGRGAFYVGGFSDISLLDTVRNLLIQGGITLRGYPPVGASGRSYVLGNAEYHFPIVNIDRGPSTLPIFLNRITGNVFFDYGSAFDLLETAAFKSGTGAELWFDTTLGYVAAFTFRLGYAKGLASGGIDKVYFVAAVPY